ncbi:MAG: hypothetical protein Q8Q12_18950 [bacterium]|nr:hypothetical protein [bacterium]
MDERDHPLEQVGDYDAPIRAHKYAHGHGGHATIAVVSSTGLAGL